MERSNEGYALGVLWSIALLGLGVAIFIVTLSFPPPGQANDPGTAALPRMIAAGLTLLAIIQLLRPERVQKLPRGGDGLRVGGLVILLLCYAAMFELIGFILSSILFLIGGLLIAGIRNLLTLALLPLATSVILYYLFYGLLEVSLPVGPVGALLP